MITMKYIRHASLALTISLLASSLATAGISAALPFANLLKSTQKVGVVTIEGLMTKSGKTVEELQTFFKNQSIKAIVLKINSGGGAPGTAQAIYHVVHELKKTYPKPVVAWVENMAASGAYYAACSADVIIASPSAIVGSIGVIGQVWQLKNIFKRFDIEQEIITSGDYKAFGSPLNAITDEQKAMYQDVCNSTYQRFISDVQQSRPKLAERSVEEWANGRIFDADRGIKLGLVDLLGSQITVEQTIKDLTQDIRDITFAYPSPTPFFMSHLDKQKLMFSTMVDSMWDRLEQKIEHSGNLRIKLIG